VAGRLSASDILKQGHLRSDSAEGRLVEIFALIEQARFQEALARSETLVKEQPHFQLAQLVHGDLLRLRYQPPTGLGSVSMEQEQAASAQLAALRAETRKRLEALRERPPQGTVPHQFIAISGMSRHAIAIDASRSRLYLFENQTAGTAAPASLQLVGDFFISVGKSGIRKKLEGDGKTPLGVYYVTSMRDRKSLPEFYGAGALPINYPNALDVQRSQTGSGIWLHGSPPNQFVRPPLASDGCVVLSNPDMEQLLQTVAPKTTPVVIAEQLQWVKPQVLEADRTELLQLIQTWQQARSAEDPAQLAQWFSPQFQNGKPFAPGKAPAQTYLAPTQIALGVSQPSLLRWTDHDETLVATFEETVGGQPSGVWRRQYWSRQPAGWKLFQDTVLSGTPAASLKRPEPAKVLTASATREGAEPEATLASSPQAAEVERAVRAWAKAWSQKNMVAYLGAYDTSFDPPGQQGRKAWEQDRRDRILHKNKIEVNLNHLAVRVDDNHAVVHFVQHYRADALNVSSRKTLKMIRRADKWLITQETVGGGRP
jgi:murein L,D-transpeptidase YafK